MQLDTSEESQSSVFDVFPGVFIPIIETVQVLHHLFNFQKLVASATLDELREDKDKHMLFSGNSFQRKEHRIFLPKPNALFGTFFQHIF